MLDRIIQISINNKLIIALLVLNLIGFGIYEFTQLPIDAVPDITDNQVQIITVSPSLGAPDIERLITFPIEQATTTIYGIKEIRSFSRFGLSLVTIVFKDDIDVYFARQQVSERLQQISSVIPSELGIPELAPITTGLGEIYQYVVRTTPEYRDFYSLEELREIQDWIVRRQLLGVYGVADVSSFGGKLKQYHIKIDPQKLRSFSISLNDVFTALELNNQNTGGSYIEKGPTVLFIRSEGLLKSIPDIESIPITYHPNGTPILIKDVARVEIDHATRYGAMTYNDEGETVGAIVMMLKGANSNLVIDKVKERISEIQQSLPKGVFIEPFLDRTKMVNNAISTVETNLMEGALIVVFVLVLFLGNLRAGFIVASIIPLSMLFAVIMMNIFGVSGNLMSLGALDFGLIVDGAVIIVEAVMHRLRHSKLFISKNLLTQGEMDSEVAGAAGKMMNSAVFGQIIILIVYLPIFSLQGIEGKMFQPMAQTVMFALLGAFILSLTYIPMISSVFLSKNINHKRNFSDRMIEKIEQIFLKMQHFVLGHKGLLFSSVSAVFIGSFVLLLNMGGEFIPALEEGDFAVDTRVLTGSNLTTSIEYTQKTAGLLKEKYPEVIKIITKIGSGEIPTDPMPIEASDMMVILKPKKEWTSAKTFPELAEKMGETLSEVPGVTAGFQFPVQMRFNELMTGARQDVVCKIFGENLDSLAQYAEKLGQLAETIDGAKDVYVEPVTGMPQIIIRPDRNQLNRYRLTVNDVNQVIKTALAGSSAGMIFEGERQFDLIVKLDNKFRNSVEDIANILISIDDGRQIPLKSVASVAVEVGPNQIQREDAKRRIIVGFNVRGRDVQSIVADLQEKVLSDLNMSSGYFVTYGGAFENLEAAKLRLAIAVPIALGLIFILLYFAFGSIKKGLLIYTAIPLSAIGGILALYTRGMPFSISAGIGFIALFGVAVLNGIVLIAEFSRLKEVGKLSLNDIVIQGTKTRLRPVLMTATVASLGFLPMALSNGAGAEVQRPLATVVIGGLIVATFLTLFVLPALYMTIEGEYFKSKFSLLAKTSVFLGFLFLSKSAFAQSQYPQELNLLIETAYQNNLQLKQSTLNLEFAEIRKGTSWNIPKTTVLAEFGNFNSFESDSKFGIEQNIEFPSIYFNRKSVFNARIKQAKSDVEINKIKLKSQIIQLFYELNTLYTYQDELHFWKDFVDSTARKIDLQVKSGAITNHDASSFRLQIQQIKHDETSTSLRILSLEQELKRITQINDLPNFSDKIQPPEPVFAQSTPEHPLVFKSDAKVSEVESEQKMAIAQWYPSFSFGLYSMSFKGSPDQNGVPFTSSDRFTSFQIGLNIPLFFNAQSNQVKMANRLVKSEKLARVELIQKIDNLQKLNKIQLQQLWMRILEMQAQLLPNIASSKRALQAQLNSGSISQTEWLWTSKQIWDSQKTYFATLIEYINLYSENELWNHSTTTF